MKKPLAIDLFCGKGGWSFGLIAAGWRVIGFDIERHADYPGELVLQDVATLDGRQFRGKVDLIVASPPCQAYSYRAMPWKRAKALPPPDNTLFDACFRIAEEAGCPIIVENVKGAQKWVGRAKWHYGSFYLWGDVPALMPITRRCGVKVPGLNWSGSDKPGYVAKAFNTTAQQRLHDDLKVPGFNFHQHEKTGKPGGSFQSAAVKSSTGSSRLWKERPTGSYWSTENGMNANGDNWKNTTNHTRREAARKEASARIAMIPFPLAKYIGECFLPHMAAETSLRGDVSGTF